MHRIGIIALALFPLTLTACGSEDPGPGTTLPACAEDDFSASPFAGPGYDPQQGLLGPAQDSYVAHSTFIAVRPEAMEQFGQLMQPLLEALPTQPGLVGYSLGFSEQCGRGRTLAVWESEEAMMDFVLGDAHIAAMSQAGDVASAAKVTHWDIQAADVPLTWEAALAKIDEVELIAY